jgi:hypothetical protein
MSTLAMEWTFFNLKRTGELNLFPGIPNQSCIAFLFLSFRDLLNNNSIQDH